MLGLTRHRTHHKHDHGRFFAQLALIIGISNAAFWTIFPLFADSILQSEAATGLFFAVVNCLILIASIMSSYLLTRVSRLRLIRVSFIACSLFLVLFIFAGSIIQLYAVELARAFFTLLIGIILSLYIRDSASQCNLGATEGRYYLYANIGWLIGPLLGGYISSTFSYDAVFLLSASLYILAFLLFLYHERKGHPHITHGYHEFSLRGFSRNIKDFFAKPQRRLAYLVAFGMNTWWAIRGIYIPLFIIANGLSERYVGLVVAGGVLPLVALEQRAGILSDKKGLRPLIIAGFWGIAATTLLFNLPSLTFVLFLMAAINSFAALIEPLQETFLFLETPKRDDDRFYGVYNTAEPLANIVAPLLAASFFIIGGFAGVWIGAAMLMATFGLFSLYIRRKESTTRQR